MLFLTYTGQSSGLGLCILLDRQMSFFCDAVGPCVRVWEDYILPLEDMLIVEEQ
jgi:hypothetical protein